MQQICLLGTWLEVIFEVPFQTIKQCTVVLQLDHKYNFLVEVVLFYVRFMTPVFTHISYQNK